MSDSTTSDMETAGDRGPKASRDQEDAAALPELSVEQEKRKQGLFQQPVKACDLSQIQNIADLVDAYSHMSIQARNLGGCLKVYEAMLADPDRPTILLGLAGPLIAGGLRRVICDMMEHRLVDVVVSTGAILYQDFFQARGHQHWKGSSDADDAVLRELCIDRIYDTYVDEKAFWETDLWISRFADTLEKGKHSSRSFLNQLAAHARQDEHSILGAARRNGVPIFCPALNDSSIGIGLTEHYHRCRVNGTEPITIDSIRDNYELTQIVVKSRKTAAVYIAGGVPKNYINDSMVMAYIFGVERAHSYAIQLTTDVPHWGGLSGSTLDEAKSWGKIEAQATSQMAFVEPTVSLPLLVGAILQKDLTANRPRLRFDWEQDVLKKLTVDA